MNGEVRAFQGTLTGRGVAGGPEVCQSNPPLLGDTKVGEVRGVSDRERKTGFGACLYPPIFRAVSIRLFYHLSVSHLCVICPSFLCLAYGVRQWGLPDL